MKKKVFKLHQNAMRKTFQLNDPLESFKMWTMRAFISRPNCSPLFDTQLIFTRT